MSEGRARQGKVTRRLWTWVGWGMWLSLCLASALGVADEEVVLTPRGTYNQGLTHLNRGEIDRAIERFMAARDEAGKDGDLRFRAAFNLGSAYAARADSHGAPQQQSPESLEACLDDLRNAAAWFRDAVRQRPTDTDARHNLEVVLRQAQVLVDFMNRGSDRLERQLDALIEGQRGMREEIRQLSSRVQVAQSAQEPLSFMSEFRSVASRQRTLISDANGVAESAWDEIGHLQGMAEEERSEADTLRLYQIQTLSAHVEEARRAMADTRRLLRDLDAEPAHRRADAALRGLMRAREQLANPLEVLRAIAADHEEVWRYAQLHQGLTAGAFKVEGGEGEVVLPAWLNPGHLSEAQGSVQARLQEMAQRLGAAVAAAGAGEGPEVDAQAAALIAAAAEALPEVELAIGEMDAAIAAFGQERVALGAAAQERAMRHLAAALERFAALKSLIEIAWAEQQQVTRLAIHDGSSEAAEGSLAPAERQRLLREGVERNWQRMIRLEGLLEQEGAGAEGEEAGALFAAAEEARQQTLAGLAQVARALGGLEALPLTVERDEEGSEEAYMAEVGRLSREVFGGVQQANAGLEQLRLLFMTLIEHIQELGRVQVETLDRSARAAAELPEDEAVRALLAGPLSDRQRQHETVALALAEALEAQADQAMAAGDGPNAGGASPAETAQKLGQAAGELQSAAAVMRLADGALSQSPSDFSAAVRHQEEAVQHIHNALALLQPPQQQPQDEQEEEEASESQMSEEQAQRKLQEIREREAERRRQRDRRQAPPEPVERDW